MSRLKRTLRRRIGKKFKCRNKAGGILGIIITIVLLLFVVCIVHFEYEVAPFMEDYTVIKAKQMMCELFGETVTKKIDELGISYESMTEISYSQSGEVQAVNTDVHLINKLKNAVTVEIADILKDEYEYAVEIPVGSLFDSEFLSGSGWKLKFNNTVTGDVRSDFRSEFETGGLNQTVHRLYIDITGELIVIAGGRQEPISFTDSVLVGETVLVGNVPHTVY